MAAKPHLLSLTATLLAPALIAGSLFGGILMAAAPAAAQTVIGGQASGDVQVNLQALDQLGGGYAAPGAAGFSYPAASGGRPPLPGEVPPPQPLLGETGNPRGLHLQARHKTVPISSLANAEPVSPQKKAAAPARAKPAAMPKPAAEAAAPARPAAESKPETVTETASAPAAEPAAAAPAPAAAPAGMPMPTTPPAASESAAAAPARPEAAPPAPAAAAPPPAPAAAPAPAPQQVATAPVAPPSAAPANPASQQSAMVAPKAVPGPAAQGGVVTISFAANQAELPKDNTAALDALAAQLAKTEDRLQIRAYAASTGTDGGSGARRLSLSRALAVRAYLIDKGIRSTRIDVRALGTPTDGSAADRVEIAPVGH